MNDENSKNQDLNLDQSLANAAEDEDSLLLDIDAILLEEDPEFLKQLSKIKIDAQAVDVSIMEKALGYHENSQDSLFSIFKRPFEFKSNPKQTLLFWITFVLVVSTIKLTWSHKDKIFHQNLFLNSLAELGTGLIDYNPNSEVEPFYDNPRFSKNLVTISPMHVNVKSSENSGDNPMLAIEVTIEGLSPDAIIEVKDREAEFKDLMLRHTEDKTYDELVEGAGKQALCDQYRELLNSLLTRGQVRRVLLKSFIIKP